MGAMSELAGFEGGLPGWLPPAAARSVAEAERVCARESRHAEAEREARAESSRSRAIEAYRIGAGLRGEVITPLQLATGAGLGRSLADVFDEARRMADLDDARQVARVKREGQGRPVPLQHVEFDEPQIHTAARSETGLKIFNRARHFRDRLATQRAAEAADRNRDHFSLAQPVTLRQP